MVGLSIVLEGQKNSIISVSSSSSSSSSSSTKKVINNSKVINKANMIINNNNNNNNKASSFSSFTTTFLDQCFLCNQKLLLGKDIYMYKGDRAFCSVECRYKQIFMDEEESKSIHNKNNCSLAAIKPTSSSSSSSRHRKGTRNRAL